MEFYKLIENRETIRVYDSEKEIPREVLSRILNAGRLAPSASNRQPWTFVLAASESKLQDVRATYQREWFQKAPYIVVVVGDKTKSWVRPKDGYNSIETDLAIAMDHMLLAAENEGVGACWVIAFDYDMLAKAIGLKENEVIFSMAAMGYPSEGFHKKGNKKRKPIEEIVRNI